MKYLEILKLVLSLVPMLIEIIKAIEEAIPGQGKGEAKLAAVRAMLEAAYGVASGSVGTFESIWPAIAGTVGALVNLFNTTGIFRKS